MKKTVKESSLRMFACIRRKKPCHVKQVVTRIQSVLLVFKKKRAYILAGKILSGKNFPILKRYTF